VFIRTIKPVEEKKVEQTETKDNAPEPVQEIKMENSLFQGSKE
jgi:hypothetical protein